MQDLKNQTFEYYKELYEKELKKNEELTEALVTAEAQRDDYKFHLDNIHNSLLWRVMYPFRMCWSHFKNIFIRIRRYSSFKQLMKKIQSKIIERKAYKSYGTLSMPSEEEIKRQRDTKFSKDITISILVPLYNTPEKFLREMIDSVVNQTYVKWELCLADGSDDSHTEVGRICDEYVKKDEEVAKSFGLDKSRIIYKKLDKNLGISGNTNACLELATGEYIGLFDHDDLLHPEALYE